MTPPRTRLTTSLLWGLLREPRSITLLTLLGYVVAFLMGVSALIEPPGTISREIGWLTGPWAAALILGGLLGAAATPRGIWWVERLGITATATGALMYLATVLMMHFSTGGNRLIQAGFVTLALIALATRWWRIRLAALDPRPPDLLHRAD